MRVVLTLVRREAVLARRDVRCSGLGKHAVHLPHSRADGFEALDRLVKKRMQREQRAEIEPHSVIDVIVVECEDCGVAHVQTGTAQDPELDSQVEDEDLFEPRGRGLPPISGPALKLEFGAG